MLVVPELEQELAVAEATRATQFELKMLRNARSDLDTQVCGLVAVNIAKYYLALSYRACMARAK
jgi:hypothetical protein